MESPLKGKQKDDQYIMLPDLVCNSKKLPNISARKKLPALQEAICGGLKRLPVLTRACPEMRFFVRGQVSADSEEYEKKHRHLHDIPSIIS
jgi:hypothetical protein